MDKIKELWSRLLTWIQGNPVVAGVVGLVLLVGLWFGYKRMKRQRMYRRAAARARRAKKRKRSRR